MTLLMKSRLTRRYFLHIYPILTLFLCLFVLVLLYQESENKRENKKSFLQNNVQQLSRILSEPLWQYSDNVINAIVDSAFEGADLLCIKLTYEGSVREPLQKGQCDDVEGEVISAEFPIVYQVSDRKFMLGGIYISSRFDYVFSDTIKDVKYILAVSMMIYLVLAFVTLRTFHFKLLMPLYDFLKSIDRYKLTGERLTVDYKSDDELGELISLYNEGLKKQVQIENDLLQARERAEETLNSLKATQAELIQAEKMASLGGLVAGVSHEINTPLGNAITVSTTLMSKTNEFNGYVVSGQIKRSLLSDYVNNMLEGCMILERNLQRASGLIAHFKQLAVDQTSISRRKFELKSIVDDVLITLRPTLKNTPHVVSNEINDSISFDSYPGPLGQVLTNIICNALVHAFQNDVSGRITLKVDSITSDYVKIVVSDDGVGIKPEDISHVFDPFYSTRFGQGGSGLGLHICYNLVTGILGGKISMESDVGVGSRVIIDIPLVAPSKDEEG